MGGLCVKTGARASRFLEAYVKSLIFTIGPSTRFLCRLPPMQKSDNPQ